MSSYDNPTYIARAVALGAKDFLCKTASRDAFLSSLRNAAFGFEPPQLSKLTAMKSTLSSRTDFNSMEPLTKRETQILIHVALGLRNREGSSSNLVGKRFNGSGFVSGLGYLENERFSYSLRFVAGAR